MAEMWVGELRVAVVRKDIRNVHLSVYPPAGRVRISAPRHLSDAAIRAFVIGKLGWIRRQQAKLQTQERETPREYLDRETHYVWGRRCLLQMVEREGTPTVDWHGQRLVLTVRPGTSLKRREEILEAWYREQLREAVPPLVDRWQRRLGVQTEAIVVRRMRTRWGSCTPSSGRIRLNTNLAKKPRQCLEYVLVHELLHLIEPTHNARFVGLMDRHMPGWRQQREELNRYPVRHEEWAY